MKKKGFTLIELLAVLVVLAILALITIPLVIGIIKNAREKSNERSIEAYGRAVENAVGVYLLNNPNEQPTTIPISSLGINTSGKTVTCDNTNVIINTNGSIRLESCYVEGTDQKYNYDNKKLEKISSNTQTTYKAYSVGDVITVANEQYYVIANSETSSDYVTALKATPLTTSEVTTYGAGHINVNNRYNGAVYDNNGRGGMAYYTSETCGYVNGSWVNDGCTTAYASSEVKYAVDAWAAAKFQNSELKEVNGYSARLITFDEVHSFGYGDEPSDCGGGYCPYYPKTDSVPGWIYNNNYWYWTMNPYESSSFYVWYVYNDGSLNNSGVSTNLHGAVRPVINVYKSKISS